MSSARPTRFACSAIAPSAAVRRSTTSAASWRCVAGSTAFRSRSSSPPPACARSHRRRFSNSWRPVGRSRVTRRDHGPAHHLSLADAIDWSYRLLTDDERSLLCALSTFRGAFDLAAASAVADTDAMTTAELMMQLVDQSLMQSAPGRAGRRFRLLETVRAFVAGRVDDTQRAAAAHRHAAFFAHRVDTVGALVPGPDEDDALNQLSVEFDDVNAAFEHAVAAGDVDAAARLAFGPRLSLVDRGCTLRAPGSTRLRGSRNRSASPVHLAPRERGLERHPRRRSRARPRVRGGGRDARRRPVARRSPVLDLAPGDGRLVRGGRRLLRRGRGVRDRAG